MDDAERSRALQEEAEALDRQLVNYVVEKLAASTLAGDIMLSAGVVQQIEATFAAAARAQEAKIGAAAAEQNRGLIEALDSHRVALSRAVAATEDGAVLLKSRRADIKASAWPDINGEDTLEPGDEPMPIKALTNTDIPGHSGRSKLNWLMPFGGGVGLAGVISAIMYFVLLGQPNTSDACDLVANMRYEMNQLANGLGEIAATDQFKAVAAKTEEQARSAPLLQTLATEVVDIRSRLRGLANRQPQTCPRGR